MLYMEHFNGKVMLDFDVEGIPRFRMTAAATLIDGRENKGNIVKIMEEDLVEEEASWKMQKKLQHL